MSGSSGNTSPVYIFPVGRSRAQPKLVQSGPKSLRLGKFPGSTGSGEGEEKRTGFMSKLLKKKTMAPKSVDGSNTNSTNSLVESKPTTDAVIAIEKKPESYQAAHAIMHEESREQVKRRKLRIGPMIRFYSTSTLIFVTPAPLIDARALPCAQ